MNATEEADLTSILCAVDFSEQSQQALRWAAALAFHYRARLLVVSGIELLLAEAARVRAGVDLAKEQVEPALRDFVGAVIPAGASWAPETVVAVRVGEAHDVIISEAERQKADLVVMGTQGLGGLRKLLLGSTTERVLRRTRTPVLAVPRGGGEAAVVDAGGARLELDRILVATDFSEAAAAALRWAVTAAGTLAVPLVLAHVVPQTAVPSQWRSYADGSDEARVADARRKLEALAKDACAGHKCDILVAAGHAEDSIAEIAQAQRAGLIVMGLTSEQGASARRPGSIAYPTLSRANVPVLVVPG